MTCVTQNNNITIFNINSQLLSTTIIQYFRLIMESLGSHLSMWFWNPDIWLPPNVDWNTFKEEKIINSTIVIKPENFANFSDLWYPLPIAFCFIIARVLVEKYVLKPLGERLGIQDKPRRQPRPNSSLENFFKKSRSDQTKVHFVFRS